jgi:hypothetical protein
MIQLYLLSIVLNGLIGFLLVFTEVRDSDSIENSMKFSLSSGGFRLTVGILAALTGILKLLSPVEKQIPILGDLLPALAGIVAGFIIIFSFYRENSSKIDNEGQLDRIGDAFLHYKKAAGFALLVVAALHFLFPTALFL